MTISTDAFAWGKVGHRAVAEIAQDNLTKNAAAQVSALLASDGAKDMASVAVWSDEPENKTPPGRPMHTVRMDPDGSPYDPSRDCNFDRPCVVKAIEQAEATLSDPASPLDQRIVALKDLIHFVGDIHQPLHTAKNIGRQRVILNGRQLMLHQVWDTSIIAAQNLSYRKLARLLEDDRALQPKTGGSARDWAAEGRDIAMKEIYSETPAAGKSSPSTVLADDYTNRHWKTVETRLKQAGLRLAEVLNRIYR